LNRPLARMAPAACKHTAVRLPCIGEPVPRVPGTASSAQSERTDGARRTPELGGYRAAARGPTRPPIAGRGRRRRQHAARAVRALPRVSRSIVRGRVVRLTHAAGPVPVTSSIHSRRKPPSSATRAAGVGPRRSNHGAPATTVGARSELACSYRAEPTHSIVRPDVWNTSAFGSGRKHPLQRSRGAGPTTWTLRCCRQPNGSVWCPIQYSPSSRVSADLPSEIAASTSGSRE
jgi:hypothetical protein